MPITLAKAPKTLPKDARKLWADTFNGAFENSCQGNEKEKDECATRIAWSYIRKAYRKVNDTWVKKSEAYHDILLTITKASLQPDGSIRWQAVTSDTEPDRAEERTSLDLFNDWIERATYKIETTWLPDKPRMPFLGLSHYPSLDGFGEAGITRRMYVDGNKFKADGIFHTDNGHPVGKQLLDTIKSELALIKKGEPIEKPVRISAGWWDLEHYHSDSEFTFTRQSLLDKCPLCEKGQTSDKVYQKGQLDHFAATRVPMNPRTSIELEEKSMAKTTRKQDAATMVNEELAEQLDQKAKLVGKSEGDTEGELPEAMVIRQEDEEEKPAKAKTVKAAMKTVAGEKFPAGDFLVVEDSESPSTWHLQVRRNGEPDHKLMGAAWAALHKGFRGNKYEGPDKKKAIAALTKLYKAEDMELPTAKADVEKDGNEVEAMEYKPLGGATNLDDAEDFIDARRKMGELHSHWDMFRMVVQNIMTADDETVPDKVAAMSAAVETLGDRIDSLKAGLADAFLIQEADFDGAADDEALEDEEIIENQVAGDILMSDTQQQSTSPADTLRAQVEAAMTSGEGREAKETAIQEALNAYTETIKADLDRVAPPSPEQAIANSLEAAVAKALGPLAEQMGLIAAKLNGPQTQAQQVAYAVPQQKSMAAGYQPQPVDDGQQEPVSRQTGKASPLTAYIRRSVGLQS